MRSRGVQQHNNTHKRPTRIRLQTHLNFSWRSSWRCQSQLLHTCFGVSKAYLFRNDVVQHIFSAHIFLAFRTYFFDV